MLDTLEQKIEVRPSTLNNLIVGVSNGQYRIPRFQREFVWNKSKVVELFDSIYREYPIGSFFLWKAGREQNNLFRNSTDFDIPPLKKDDDVSFIILEALSFFYTVSALSALVGMKSVLIVCNSKSIAVFLIFTPCFCIHSSIFRMLN